jgi:outer membrane receptor protein involved in Fe transport
MSSESCVAGRDAVRQSIRCILCAGVLGLGATTAVGAEAEAGPDGLEQVVVTGTRLSATGFSTPTPVTVLDSSALEQLGISNVGAGVNQLPSFRATTTPTTNGWGSFNVGAQIVNLRGLGVTRNLVLVDSRRFAPVTREGTADLNLIPTTLVKRIEVVTGGASAQYGSDAITGVVNVLLDKDLNGIKGQADYGVTEEGDGDNFHVSLAGGMGFADDRGHFVLGGEYSKQDGIGDCFTRSYCEGGVVVTNTGAGRVNNGQPNFYRQAQGGGFLANTNGVLNSLNNTAAAQQPILNLFGTGGVTFDDNGTPIPYTLGLPASGITGAGSQTVSSFTTSQLEVPVERYATFGHAYFDFTDSFRGFLEGSYGHVDGSVLQSRYFGAPISIFNDNPYVPAAIRALLPPASATPSPVRPANNLAALNLAVLGQRRGESRSKADAWRVTTGYDWKLNESWTTDAYYQYANTDRYQEVQNALVTGASRVINRPGSGGVSNPESYAYFAWATDPVYDPADAALPPAQRRIVCRATISTDAALRAAAAGCVPFNPFGTANTSEAALDYVYRTLMEEIDISQHVVAANIRGQLAELWAGPLEVAAGAEYRRDEMELVHDPLSNVFAYFQNFGADFDGKQDVVEGYVEANLPLLRDVTAAQSLSLNAAVRYANYDVSGFGSYNQAPASNSFDATTWKVGLVWEPLDWMRMRATLSEDLRAPNFFDLFQASASNFTPITNRFLPPSTPPPPQEFPVQLTGGNPTLGPETGHTMTVGLVLQPTVIPRFSLSLDYYDIKVDDYIATPGGAQNIVDQCALFGNQEMCSLITLGANNSLVEIRNVNVNLQWLKVRGLDIEAAYNLPLSSFSSLPGGFNFRLLATKTFENTTNLFGTLTDRVGETGSAVGQPDWLATLVVGYANGGLQANLTTRYISSGVLNALYSDPTDEGFNPALPNTINDNRVGSAVYFNLNGSWAFGESERYQVFAQVNNLFDRAPPLAPQLQFPSNPVYFDLIGRSYRAGVRFNF